MSFTPQLQNKFQREVMEDWSKLAHRVINRAIKKRKQHIPINPADEKQLRDDIDQELAAMALTYKLTFADSGRLVDMKRLVYSGRPITHEKNFILEWAKKRGRKKFRKGVPGYKNRKAPNLDDDKALMRIASAIIASYDKTGHLRRRRGQWYSKTLYRLISRLIRMYLRRQSGFLAEHVGEDMRNVFRT